MHDGGPVAPAGAASEARAGAPSRPAAVAQDEDALLERCWRASILAISWAVFPITIPPLTRVPIEKTSPGFTFLQYLPSLFKTDHDAPGPDPTLRKEQPPRRSRTRR